MAWQQTAVLLVLSLTFLPSEGWEPILLGASESSLWEHDDSDDDYTEGEAVAQVGESPNFLPYAAGGFQVQFMDVNKNGKTVTEPAVSCSEYEFNITLPAGWPLSDLVILGSKRLPVLDALESCGYLLTRGYYQNTLIVPFSGCPSHVTLQAGRHVLRMLYVDQAGEMDIATVSCEASPESSEPTVNLSNNGPQVRSLPTSRCAHKGADHVYHEPSPHVHEPSPHVHHEPSKHVHHEPSKHVHEPSKHVHHEPPKHVHYVPETHLPSGCSIPKAYQVTCGSGKMSSSQCLVKGCCVDSATSACYYPMDECTMDKQFVFAIHDDIASVSVDPTKLLILGKQDCKPVVANEKFAIFQFKVDDCSTRSYHIGDTMIYLVEVQSPVKALSLKYGIITRDDPLRIMVECRYPRKDSGNLPSVASVGYMVMSPSSSLPSSLKSEGLFGVELRIAKDKTYSTYFTHHHQPLKVLLGNPVYLEVRLKSATPKAVVLVNYCLAYPRSATNALVLVHEGCANPLDPNVSILKVDDLPQNRNVRRFVLYAFIFMDHKTNQYLNEEIYFMCSTEVCMPTEKTCEERCFDGKPSPSPHHESSTGKLW